MKTLKNTILFGVIASVVGGACLGILKALDQITSDEFADYLQRFLWVVGIAVVAVLLIVLVGKAFQNK